MSEIRNKPFEHRHKLCLPICEIKEPRLSLLKNPPNGDCLDWADYLTVSNIMLIDCHNDLRKLKFYITELQSGTFLVELYTDSIENMLRDPDEDGWICTSKWFYIQDGKIIDPYTCHAEKIGNTHVCGYYAKHIFLMNDDSTN